ncbi:MAG: hypothetical protein KGL72_07065 [Actinomycetales bacterium]|nr:hypothetical protein [Actinomycetales bacterium]
MPKNEENYVPTAESIANAEAAATAAPRAPRTSRRLGTGAIIGISAAGVALLAGTFGAGAAVGATVAHNSRPGIGQMGDFAQRDQMGGQMGGQRDQMGGQQGQMGQQNQNGQTQQGQRPQRQQGTAPNGTAPTAGPQAMGPNGTTGGSN